MKNRTKLVIAVLFYVLVGLQYATAQDSTIVKYQRVEYSQAIDPEAIILIEDMLEYAEWDIQEGMMDAHIGMLLIANLNDLKAKLQ